MYTRLVLAVGLVLQSTVAWATEVPLTADTSISSASRNANFGGNPNLTVGGGSISLMRFDLSALPAGATGGGILKASLQVFVSHAGTAGTIQVSPVESTWTESVVTYGTIPAIGLPGTSVEVSDTGGYISFDVTAQVAAWIQTPGSNFGLALSSSEQFTLDSKENTATSHPATLDITLAVAPQGGSFVQSYGDNNVSAGPNSLPANTGYDNTAFGADALQVANPSVYNTAIGFQALQNTTTGSVNTAVGAKALGQNTTGSRNNAFGFFSLGQNTTGDYNTAVGFYALNGITSGTFNTALGPFAGWGEVNGVQTGPTGSRNILIGVSAGANTTTGDSNVEIGNQGTSADSNLIRIGDRTQSQAFIAGIRGVQTGASDAVDVVIDSNGQLGTINSSQRFKHDIANMGEASDGLMRLRPVTFHYNQPSIDGVERLEYGLIAEEVAGIYPEAVTHTPNGDTETIQYHKINAMMLNEIQKQHRTIEQQTQELDALRERLAVIEKSMQAEHPGNR